MAPLAEINIQANYQNNPNFGGTVVELPPPMFVGKYLRVSLGHAIASLSSINWAIVEDSSYAHLSRGWLDDRFLNLLVSPNEQVWGKTLEVVALYSVPVPTSDSSYEIEIPGGFTASRAALENGSTISSTAIATIGSIVTINIPHDPPVGSKLFVTGSQVLSQEIIESAATLAFATFSLAEHDLTFLDSLDFMGMSFTPAQNGLEPRAREFLWNDTTKACTIFAKIEQLAGVRAGDAIASSYISSIGAISY